MASSIQQPLSFAPWLGAALVIMIAGCGDDGSASDSMSEATSASSGNSSTTASTGTGNESESSSTGSTSDTTTTATSATSATTTTTGTSTTAATSDSDSSTSSTGGGQAELADLLSADLWEQMYPERNALFTYEALISAAADFPDFATQGDDNTRRRELAAFLANIAHETTGGWKDAPGGPYAWGLYFKEEVGCEMGDCVGYCDPNNVQYPCAPGVTYHGRGPIQLSWNYNYGQAGDALGQPLLTEPGLITSDGAISFSTALWFWMTPQAPKPSAHDVMIGAWTPSADDLAKGRKPGFGMTINIINGGLECGQPTPPQVESRLGFYARMTELLDVTGGENTTCESMQPYG